MPIKILMPALSPTMLEGNLIKWLKKENDYVKAGEVLAEIETDKATMEIEAVDEGILGKIVIKEGTKHVPVNSIIAVLLEEGETVEEIAKMMEQPTAKAAPAAIPTETSAKITDKVIATKKEDNSRIFVSPVAKRIAENQNIDLRKILGSGPQGRIIKADVENKNQTTQTIRNYSVDSDNIDTRREKSMPISTRRATSDEVCNVRSINCDDYYLVPNNNIRKIVAERLLESTQTIPHFYLSIECNIDKLLDSREDINQGFELKEDKVSINDFIVLAVAKSLSDVKEVNASWEESNIKYYNNIDISIAVATDHGLVTPIVRNADQKNIILISKEIKELAVKAKANKLRLDEFQGGGFSISNLGMYGIKNFAAIINPPQSCILAVGASSKRPIVIDDKFSIANIMDVTLSCDHRVVDGAVGAKFLTAFKKYIEHPFLMMI